MYWKRGFTFVFVFTIGLLALTAWGFEMVTAVPAAPASSDFVNIYAPNPLDGSTPRQMIQDGNIFWFTDPGRNAIGKLVVTDTVDFDFTFYPIASGNSQPYDLVKDGNTIWFTQLAANKIGRLDATTGAITDYDIPTTDSEPTGIDVANDGTVWFVQRAGNNLARFNPTTTTFAEFLYDETNAALEDVIVIDNENLVWFTAPGVKKVGGFNTNLDTFTSDYSFAPPVSPIIYTPSQVIQDNKGNLWISSKEGVIGRFSPSTVQIFFIIQVAPDTSSIDGLFWRAEGSGSQFWFTESNTGFVGRVDLDAIGGVEGIMRFTPGSTGGGIYGITAESDGTAWIASSNTGAIIEWVPPYFIDSYLPLISK